MFTGRRQRFGRSRHLKPDTDGNTDDLSTSVGEGSFNRCCANPARGCMQTSGYSPSIKQLLDRSGNDKGKWYGGMYAVLLQPSRHAIKSVIEIGIGTLIPECTA
jgi:hypothetical protein